eukprot:12903050-Prorocentrum_lima.AAC.1
MAFATYMLRGIGAEGGPKTTGSSNPSWASGLPTFTATVALPTSGGIGRQGTPRNCSNNSGSFRRGPG